MLRTGLLRPRPPGHRRPAGSGSRSPRVTQQHMQCCSQRTGGRPCLRGSPPGQGSAPLEHVALAPRAGRPARVRTLKRAVAESLSPGEEFSVSQEEQGAGDLGARCLRPAWARPPAWCCPPRPWGPLVGVPRSPHDRAAGVRLLSEQPPPHPPPMAQPELGLWRPGRRAPAGPSTRRDGPWRDWQEVLRASCCVHMISADSWDPWRAWALPPSEPPGLGGAGEGLQEAVTWGWARAPRKQAPGNPSQGLRCVYWPGVALVC